MQIVFLLILCVLFWSGNFILGKYISKDIEAIQLAFFRWGGVVILVAPVLFKNFYKIIDVIRKNFLILNILALLGISLFNIIIYLALSYTKAINVLLINSFIPIITLIFSFIILKIKLNKIQLFGIILSTIGVIFIISKGNINTLKLLEFNNGDLWVLVSSSIWALYSILLEFKPKSLNGFEFFTTLILIGFFYLIIIYIVAGYSIIEDISLIQNNYELIIYLIIFPSLLSFYFWNKGIEEIGANATTQFTHLMPIFGFILAYIFLGEVLKGYHIIGAILIGMGIFISLFIGRRL